MRKFRFLSANEKEALTLLLCRIKQELKEEILQIKFFGSKAKGNFAPDSDIDILLIVKSRTEKVLDKIAEIHLDVDLKYDPNISLIIFSEDEYQQNRKLETPFIRNIERESIPL